MESLRLQCGELFPACCFWPGGFKASGLMRHKYLTPSPPRDVS
jgi:hypothetical protein